MNIRILTRAIALALALPVALAACGGGGAGGGQLIAPAAPPPPAPPAPPPAPCPAPLTGDCVLTGSPATQVLPGGRQSAHALVIGDAAGPVTLELWLGDDSRFDGGTRIENGWLKLSTGSVRAGASAASLAGTVLESNVFVSERGRLSVEAGGQAGGELRGNVENHGLLEVYGRVRGNVANFGKTGLMGSISGNVTNQARLDVGSPLGGPTHNRIDGDFRQTGSGTLGILLPAGGDWAGAHTSNVSIGGRAELDGILELQRATWNDYGAWYGYVAAPLPDAPISFQILHAQGGVFGRFSGWKAADWLDENDTPRPLFISGSLRYGTHDVWFDLTRASLSAAMAASGPVSALTLASAGNLDRALSVADGFLRTPDAARQRLLATAGRLLWMRDAAQAARALDTLAGTAHVQAARSALEAAGATGLATQLDAVLPGARRAHWTRMHGAEQLSGADAWLSPHLLAGAYARRAAQSGEATLGAASSQRDSGTGLYLRHVRDGGWYLGAEAGYATRTVALFRPIDFGAAGRWSARSQRRFDVATLAGEAGRGFALGAARLTPFLRLEASALQADAAIEQGHTGFELALAPLRQQRLQAGAGLRYARDWRVGMHRARLDASMGATHALLHAGGAQRAAFTGVPDAGFALPWRERGTRGWFDLGLESDAGSHWQWAVHGARLPDAGAAWRLQLARPL